MPLDQALHVELNTLAKRLAQFGRGKDSVLAHITPREAQLLKARGGRGSANPVTGLLEFDDTPVPEQVDVTAPVSQPNIEAPPPEQVTSTATKQQQPAVAAPTDFAFPQAQAPQTTQPAAPAQAPAPEQVTVSAPAIQPQTFGAFQAPFIPPQEQPVPEQSANDQTKGFLDRNKTLLELGGLGALGLYGGINAGRAAGQAQQLQNNIAALGAPLQAQGNAALAGVNAGALNPANMQALQAARAQTAAGQTTGAVSSQQAAETISTTFANLLNNQLNQALALLNTADSYLQQAYIQGYQANIQNQANTQNFYANLAQLATRLAGGSA